MKDKFQEDPNFIPEKNFTEDPNFIPEDKFQEDPNFIPEENSEKNEDAYSGVLRDNSTPMVENTIAGSFVQPTKIPFKKQEDTSDDIEVSDNAKIAAGVTAGAYGAKKVAEGYDPFVRSVGKLGKDELDLLRANMPSYKNVSEPYSIAKKLIPVVEEIEEKGRSYTRAAKNMLNNYEGNFSKSDMIKNVESALLNKKAILDVDGKKVITETFAPQYKRINAILREYPNELTGEQVDQLMHQLGELDKKEDNILAKSVSDHVADDIDRKVKGYKKLYVGAADTFADKKNLINNFNIGTAETSSGVQNSRYIATEDTVNALSNYVDPSKKNEEVRLLLDRTLKKYGHEDLGKQIKLSSIKDFVKNKTALKSAGSNTAQAITKPLGGAVSSLTREAVGTVGSFGTKLQELLVKLERTDPVRFLSILNNFGKDNTPVLKNTEMLPVPPIKNTPKLKSQGLDLAEQFKTQGEVAKELEIQKEIEKNRRLQEYKDIQEKKVKKEWENKFVAPTKEQKVSDYQELKSKLYDNEREIMSLTEEVQNPITQKRISDLISENEIIEDSMGKIGNEIKGIPDSEDLEKTIQKDASIDSVRNAKIEEDINKQLLDEKNKEIEQQKVQVTNAEKKLDRLVSEEYEASKKLNLELAGAKNSDKILILNEYITSLKKQQAPHFETLKNANVEYKPSNATLKKEVNAKISAIPKEVSSQTKGLAKGIAEGTGNVVKNTVGDVLKSGGKAALGAIIPATALLTYDDALAEGRSPEEAAVIAGIDFFSPLPVDARLPFDIGESIANKEYEDMYKSANLPQEQSDAMLSQQAKYLQSQAVQDKNLPKEEMFKRYMSQREQEAIPTNRPVADFEEVDATPKAPRELDSEEQMLQDYQQYGNVNQYNPEDSQQEEIQAEQNYGDSQAYKDKYKMAKGLKDSIDKIEALKNKVVEPTNEYNASESKRAESDAKIDYGYSPAYKDAEKKQKSNEDIINQNKKYIDAQEKGLLKGNVDWLGKVQSSESIDQLQANFSISPAVKKRLGLS